MKKTTTKPRLKLNVAAKSKTTSHSDSVFREICESKRKSNFVSSFVEGFNLFWLKGSTSTREGLGAI